jgi:16S rRNA (guanine527-N7)-methyltransferase
VRAETPFQILERGAAELGVVLSSDQLGQIERYLAELQKWNRRINLTGTNQLEELVTRHVLDSLAGLIVLSALPAGASVADLGSGAGFPGLPIKIARPDLRITMIEPRQKRAAFLTTVCALIKIQGVEIVEATIDPKHPPAALAGRFDCVLTRAVAEPQAAKGVASPLLRSGGLLVIWASEHQAASAGPGFTVRRYRIPYTELRHALLVWHAPA